MSGKSTKTVEDLTPTARLAYAQLSTAELKDAFKAVEEALVAAEESILGAKRRKEDLAAEMKERMKEEHKAVLDVFCCPKCGNKDIAEMVIGDPCGYEWHGLTDGAKEKEPRVCIYAECGDGADYENHSFVVEEGVLTEVKLGRVASCSKCEALWPWPKDLLLEFT